MSFVRPCQAVSAKCAMVPAINNFMNMRYTSNELGSLGPCQFQTPDNFFRTVNENKDQPISTPIDIKNSQTVVGIGDIHADLLVLLGTLYLMGMIDLRGNWIGNNSIVVLCGDVLDRAGRSASIVTDNVREEVDIVQYLYYLNLVAQRKGGGVYWVLGNHDIARVLWKNYEGKTIESIDEMGRRKIRSSPDYRKYIGNQSIGWGGQENMKLLFQPGGKMARYMALHTVLILQVGWYVFMHGGLTLNLIEQIYDQLNIRYPRRFFGMVNQNLANGFFSPDNKISKAVTNTAWDRTWSKEKILGRGEDWDINKYAITMGRGNRQAKKYCLQNMQRIFELTGMSWSKGAFVLGHSIQQEGIPVYCDGKVWRIDLGMSEAFSSGRMPKLIGGIKIYQYKDPRPTNVLVVMNYSTDEGAQYTDRFIMFVRRGYRHVIAKNTKISAFWHGNIDQIRERERKLQQMRMRGGKEKGIRRRREGKGDTKKEGRRRN